MEGGGRAQCGTGGGTGGVLISVAATSTAGGCGGPAARVHRTASCHATTAGIISCRSTTAGEPRLERHQPSASRSSLHHPHHPPPTPLHVQRYT